METGELWQLDWMAVASAVRQDSDRFYPPDSFFLLEPLDRFSAFLLYWLSGGERGTRKRSETYRLEPRKENSLKAKIT